jgi:hypothetical protein
MTIKIQCPVCQARNELSPDTTDCRRCSEDLSLLYAVKGHSFKYRVWLAQALLQGNLPQVRRLAQAAAWLSREAER